MSTTEEDKGNLGKGGEIQGKVRKSGEGQEMCQILLVKSRLVTEVTEIEFTFKSSKSHFWKQLSRVCGSQPISWIVMLLVSER